MKKYYDALTEKQGRVSTDKNHDSNVVFIQQYYGKEIPTSNRTNVINFTRKKFQAAIEKHDKELWKKLQNDSLDALKKVIDNLGLQLPKRRLDWKKAEEDIANGINQLLSSNFFSYVAKDGTIKKVDDVRFECKTIGGSKDSDVAIINKETKKKVFIECKLNLSTAEYFKFNIKVKNGKLNYDHSFHLRNLSNEEKSEMNDLFMNKINISGFLNEIVQKPNIKQYWDAFLSNLEQIESVIKTDDEFKQFAKDSHFSGTFPNDTDILVKIFDGYVNHYIDKYKSLVEQLYDTFEDSSSLDSPDEKFELEYDYRDNPLDAFDQVDSIIECFYAYQYQIINYVGATSELDEIKMFKIADELKTIETKLYRIMNKIGVKDPKKLLELGNSTKLQYFFAAFISTVGRKTKNGKSLLNLRKDELGNLEICPPIIVKNSRLAQMICDYYLYKDHCIYIQIDDTLYALDKNYNLFNIPNIPCFNDVMTSFTVALHVKHDLSQIELHIKANDVDKSKISSYESISLKLNDKNFIGKKFKNIQIQPNA